MGSSGENAAGAVRSRMPGFLLLLPALALFGLFFIVYVPFIRPFLAVLVPLLVLTAVLTALSREKGLLVFVLAFPLINNLPYFFGIQANIPHAPTALVLFLAFFMGCLVNGVLFESGPGGSSAMTLPLGGLSLIVFVSAAITFLRYTDFFPFASDAVRELVVNANGVRAGGAVMSDVFNALNYLTGFLFFVILTRTLRTWKDVRRLVTVLALSMGSALVFALVQRYHSIGLGNTPFWVELRQINGTFKDPNSFAAFISACVPLFLGAVFTVPKRNRIALICLIVICLFVFPSIGSRSGFAALLVSVSALAVFGVNRFWGNLKKNFVPAGLAILGICLILGGVLIAGKDSILRQRLNLTANVFHRGIIDEDFLNMRLQLWSGALRMMREYPLTGVGIGAFIIELPNAERRQESGKMVPTDSALNYFLQTGAELGVAGLFLVLWLFFEILRRMRKALLQARRETKNGSLLIGAVAAIVAFFVNFQLHTYIGSYEVIYLFWILVAVVSFPAGGEDAERIRPASRKIPAGALILILAFGSVHAWNSWRSLSISSETERYGWDQNFGFYQEEEDGKGRSFRWMRKSAGLSLPVHGTVLSLELRASHPDLAKRPVRTRIYLADKHFRKKSLLQGVLFSRNEWTVVKLPVAAGTASRLHLVFETDRDWRPRDALGVADPRSLAIALKKPRFD